MTRAKLLITVLALAATASLGTTDLRWLYVSCRFNSDADVEEFQEKCEKAAKAGYNGIQLACGIEAWHKWDDGRKARLEKARKIAAKNKLEIIPGLWSPGYGSFLGDDPNLCAATPYEGVWVRKGRLAAFGGCEVRKRKLRGAFREQQARRLGLRGRRRQVLVRRQGRETRRRGLVQVRLCPGPQGTATTGSCKKWR